MKLYFIILFLALFTLIGGSTASAEIEKTTKTATFSGDDIALVDVDIGPSIAISDDSVNDFTTTATSVGNDVCVCIGATANKLASGTSGTAPRTSSISRFTNIWSATTLVNDTDAHRGSSTAISWF